VSNCFSFEKNFAFSFCKIKYFKNADTTIFFFFFLLSIPGPVQRLDQGGVYTKERSQTEYNNLIKELTEFAPNSDVANTFQAKAYGWNQKGASMFEMHPFYPHDIGIFGPSVFFNNYGLRTFHSASGIVSWNWCAPYYLGCNTICVNGRNSIALASLVIGQELLDSVRNQMWIEMKKIMDSA